MAINWEKYDRHRNNEWPGWAKNPKNEEIVEEILIKLFDKLPESIGNEHYYKVICLGTMQESSLKGTPSIGVQYAMPSQAKKILPSFCHRLVTGIGVTLNSQGGALVFITDADKKEDNFAPLFNENSTPFYDFSDPNNYSYIVLKGSKIDRNIDIPDFPIAFSLQEILSCITTLTQIRDLCALLET